MPGINGLERKEIKLSDSPSDTIKETLNKIREAKRMKMNNSPVTEDIDMDPEKEQEILTKVVNGEMSPEDAAAECGCSVDELNAAVEEFKKDQEVNEDVQDGQPGQHNRDQNNVSADNSKIKAGLNDYKDNHKHVDDIAVVKEAAEAIRNYFRGNILTEDVNDEEDETSPVSNSDEVSDDAVEVGEDGGPENHTQDNVDVDNEKITANQDNVENAEDALADDEDPALVDGEVAADEVADDLKDDDYGIDLVTTDDFDSDEDVDAMTNTDDDDEETKLSESHKAKIKTIYEAAVARKANQVINEALKVMRQELRRKEALLESKMQTKLNDYLSVIVEEWAENNKQSLIEQTQYELNESFVQGLMTLLEDHYYEVPKDKVNLFDKVLEENIQLEDKVNELVNESIELKSFIKDFRKDQLINENSEGLSLNKKTKLKSLLENVKYDNDDSFVGKINEIKRSYFSPKIKQETLVEETTTESTTLNESVNTTDEVSAVADVISKHIK